MDTDETALVADSALVLTVPEVARTLGISRSFAYELVAAGELPSIRLGRRVVVPRRRLETFLEAAGEADQVASTRQEDVRRERSP